jgi:hypothetical protein
MYRRKSQQTGFILGHHQIAKEKSRNHQKDFFHRPNFWDKEYIIDKTNLLTIRGE